MAVRQKKKLCIDEKNFKILNGYIRNSTANFQKEPHPNPPILSVGDRFIGEHSVQRLRTRYSAVNAPATCCYSRTRCVHNCNVDCCCSGRSYSRKFALTRLQILIMRKTAEFTTRSAFLLRIN